MTITVNLWTDRTGEIKRFLERYYQKDVHLDEDVEQWIYVYNKPLEAVDLISVVMDNKDKYKLSMCIQVDSCDLHPVTSENHNDIIKGIFSLYYQEPQQINCSSVC